LQACGGEIVLIVPHGVEFNEHAGFDREQETSVVALRE
jgi:hypothetical protein